MANDTESSKASRAEVRVRLPATRVLLVLALGFFLIVTFWRNAVDPGQEHFAVLAQSFLQGKLALPELPEGGWADASPHNGQYYWPLGPFPAVLLMPFQAAAAAMDGFFYQGYLQPFLILALLAIIFRIARRIGFDIEDSAYAAFGFAFGTAFLGVALIPWSWQFAHVLTCLLLFAAVHEMLGQRRPLLLGVLFALTLATRATAALGVVWCAAEMLFAAASWRRKLCSLAALGLPLLVAVVLLLLYNYARFGNALDQGYRQQLILPWAAANRDQGILSLRHLPCNLYYLLLAAPEIVRQDTLSMVLKFPYVAANPWGMSLFLTSPCFVCLFGLRRLDATARWLLLTVLIIATPLLLYFATGYTQFGYRYSLDFLPLLYYLLLRHLHKTHGGLTTAFKVVLLATAFWNLYLFAGYYNWRAGPVPQ